MPNALYLLDWLQGCFTTGDVLWICNKRAQAIEGAKLFDHVLQVVVLEGVLSIKGESVLANTNFLKMTRPL